MARKKIKKMKGKIMFYVISEVLLIIGSIAIGTSILPIDFSGLKVSSWEGIFMGIFFIGASIYIKMDLNKTP